MAIKRYPNHWDAVKKVAEETGASEEQVDLYVRKFFGSAGLLRYFQRGYNIMLTGFGMFKMKPKFYRSIGGKVATSREEVKTRVARKNAVQRQKRSQAKKKADQKASNFAKYWERIKNNNN